MKQADTWNLLARKLTGEVTEDEQRELLSLIRSKPEIGLYLQALTNLWHQGTNGNKEKIAAAFREMTETCFPLTDKTFQHKPEASFFIPGKNSIAMNFFKGDWENIHGKSFCEDVSIN
jgi:hypothetical protein